MLNVSMTVKLHTAGLEKYLLPADNHSSTVAYL